MRRDRSSARRRCASASLALFVSLALAAYALEPSHAQTHMTASAIAPGGTLRAAINLGNPVLAGRDPATGDPVGISVDIARELGRRLGVPVQLVVFAQAGQVTDTAATDIWDIAFLATDPRRAEEIAFTGPYVLIEGAYAVRQDSPFRSVADVDRPGVRVAVVAKSAYDLFLTRALTAATLVRGADAAITLDRFQSERLDVLAGVRQTLAEYVAQHEVLRIIPGRFMAIEQAMGVPRAHAAAAAELHGFVEELKASGFIAAALARHEQAGADVAPPARAETTPARLP